MTCANALLRTALLLVTGTGLLATLSACPNGDVGAPCNHGTVDPPQTKLVSFPSLACDELLCVYGEDKVIPDDTCSSDEDCNVDQAGTAFACEIDPGDTTGVCRLSSEYVLERSMCSRACSTDDDCKNTGITSKDKPVAEDTNCADGFSCVRIQLVGEFCCDRLCVCNDNLPDTTDIDVQCEVTGPDGEPSICSQNNQGV